MHIEQKYVFIVGDQFSFLFLRIESMTIIASAPEIKTPSNPNTDTPPSKGGIFANMRIDEPTATDDISIARTRRFMVFFMSVKPLML